MSAKKGIRVTGNAIQIVGVMLFSQIGVHVLDIWKVMGYI